MEIYDSNVTDILGISSEVHSLSEVEEIHDALIEYGNYLFYNKGIQTMPHYRSEQVFGWDIIPGLFRGKGSSYSAMEGKEMEKKAMKEFVDAITAKLGKSVLRDLFDNEQFGKDWDALFQAQHAGIRTTLVDWTALIERSVYFGVEESLNPAIENADGQLWAYMINREDILSHNNYPHRDTFYDHDPASLKDGKMINVAVYLDNLEDRILESRIFRQGGRFYVSASDVCNIPLNRQPEIARNLFRFRIPAKAKATIREQLNARGLNRETIYVEENPVHQQIINDINISVFG